MRRQVASGACECPGELVDKADNLLRLELKLGASWLRRLQDVKAWHQLTQDDLIAEHRDFFGALIGQGLEVKDMGMLLKELEKVCPTKGKALAAHRTWLLIRAVGYRWPVFDQLRYLPSRSIYQERFRLGFVFVNGGAAFPDVHAPP